MKFWDTSAVIPLLVTESQTSKVEKIFEADASMVVWWGTSIECISAISRLEREGKLSPLQAESIFSQLAILKDTWWEVQASHKLKQTAERILRVHALRAQDAQQLSACIMANSENQLELVSLDDRLLSAARKEGLVVAG